MTRSWLCRVNLLYKARKNGWFGFPEYNVLHQLASFFCVTGPSSCLHCLFIEAINWLDCSFWPWRWKCKTGTEPSLLCFCWILFCILEIFALCKLFRPHLADSKRSCCCMGDFEGKHYCSHLIIDQHFHHILYSLTNQIALIFLPESENRSCWL